jgi:hypothetical protein
MWYVEIKWPFCQNAKRQRQNFLREALAVDYTRAKRQAVALAAQCMIRFPTYAV